jgi:hypothetical protein
VIVTFSQIPATANGWAWLKASTAIRLGASMRNRLPIIRSPSSKTRGPGIMIVTPKREVSARNALCAS